MNRLITFGLVAALSAPIALADFRYDQTSRMTGGAMMAMMQMAATFSKNAIQPANSTIAVRGNQMVMNRGRFATIYDLDKETITDVNFDKKEYSVTTFAEMRAFVDKAMTKTGSTDAAIEVDVKETGKIETIAGLPAKEFLMTMKVEGTNPQTGKKGEMKMEMSNWIAQKLPGYGEISDFHRRMAQKMDMASMFGGMAQAGMGKGMAAAARKMAEMDGVPVLQIMRLIPADPEQIKQMEQAQQAQAQQPQQPVPSASQAGSEAAGQAAAGAIAGRLGRLGGLGTGGLGGLGGMRRKKQQEEPAPASVPPPPSPALSTVKGSFTSEASMMEMTVESTNHSNAAVDPSLFAIPDGFKVVKSQMQK